MADSKSETSDNVYSLVPRALA